MKTLSLLVLPGDGIGPEVTAEALLILRTATQWGGIDLQVEEAAFGGCAIDTEGAPVSAHTLDLARAAGAVLLGAVGGPSWDVLPSARRPERGLLDLRAALGAFANLRPARQYSALVNTSPLRPELARQIDFVVVRELLGGIYFGEPRGIEGPAGQRRGHNTMSYTEEEIRRIAVVAFDLARSRSGRICSVDKANVLEVGALWRDVITKMAAKAPDLHVEHLYVDTCAMQLALDPARFDVLLTGNIFGDILSDEAAALTGSIGLLPSASLGPRSALYEPVHGSAPDIAGTGKANPIAAISSVAMMLEHSCGRPDLARAIDQAIESVLASGMRTADLILPRGAEAAGTHAMGSAVNQAVHLQLR